jgi:hypothetical protein
MGLGFVVEMLAKRGPPYPGRRQALSVAEKHEMGEDTGTGGQAAFFAWTPLRQVWARQQRSEKR